MAEKKLTKPQYEALCKWEKEGVAHPKALKVRDDVFMRLLDLKLIEPCGFLVKRLSEKGKVALAEYRETMKGKAND